MDVVTTQPAGNIIPQSDVPEATAETPLSDEEKEEKRRRQDECCCYFPDDDEMCAWCFLCRCIADCFYTIGQCTECCFEGCANCCSDCCESNNVDTGDSGGCLDCCGDSPDVDVSGSLNCCSGGGCDCDGSI